MNVRILIIEDEPDLAEVYKMALEEQGCSIAGVHARPSGVFTDPALFPPPDVIILDEHLDGGGSGSESIAELRRAFPLVRIILATGDTHSVTPSAKPDAVLPKPFALKSLVETIARLVA
ncbi:MAG: response regulator [Candidatus Hydrogenedentota bacterium]